MSQIPKPILISLLMFALLLGACAPAAPAGTQDPALSQQLIEQSVALTVAADRAQQKDQELIEQAVALTVAAQDVQAAQQALSATVPAAATLEPTAIPTGTNTAIPAPLPDGSTQTACSSEETPEIGQVSPPEGPTRGGTEVTIDGKNFLSGGSQGATQFYFGSNPATDVVCDDPNHTKCTAKNPQGVAGIVLVKAINVFNNKKCESQHKIDNADDGFKYNEIKYGCSVLTVTPDNLTAYKGGAGFTIKWIIKNTGQSSWPAGLNFKYAGGVNMAGISSMELPAMGPNDTYSVKLDATAPKNPSQYYMSWKVEGMSCDAFVAIVVE